MTKPDLVFAAVVIGALAVAGLAAGALWSAISSHSKAIVVSSSVIIPDETEEFVSSDGRFLIIVGAIGMAAGIIVWVFRRHRGPVAVAALAVGGTIGALITAGVGHLLSSGRSTGAVNTVITLKLSLHAYGLLAIEGGLALLVYLAGALFVSPDDLGRPADSVPPPPNLQSPEFGAHSAVAGVHVQSLDGNR